MAVEGTESAATPAAPGAILESPARSTLVTPGTPLADARSSNRSRPELSDASAATTSFPMGMVGIFSVVQNASSSLRPSRVNRALSEPGS